MRVLTPLSKGLSQRQSGDTVVTLVGELSDLRRAMVEGADAVVLTPLDERDAWDMLSVLRAHADLRVSLLPVFVHTRFANSAVVHEADGLSDGIHLFQLFGTIRDIQQRVDQVSNVPPSDPGLLAVFRTCAWMYSRESKLQPYTTRRSHIGTALPFVTLNAGMDGVHWVDIARSVSQGGYADMPEHYPQHGCKSCSSTFVNFIECCPSCGGNQLEEEPLMHHFPCAHVGPQSQFEQGDHLVCPKCTKTLRHIGIDYDKPSAQLTCKSCGHSGQQSTMQAHCMDCGSESKLPELQRFEIPHLQLNQHGMNLAVSGVTGNSVSGQHTAQAADDPQLFDQMVRRQAAMNTGAGLLEIRCVLEGYQAHAQVDENLQVQIEQALRRSLGANCLFARKADWTWHVLTPSDTASKQVELDAALGALSGMITRAAGVPASLQLQTVPLATSF